ncbi:MAG: NifB/NifX family molybdenum-iron cluster-binding protein [Pirellulales bacterium]|nr:NifB/NifX family molybdenum-iron cluster-binding protein [Pirellulales bacterium]
MSTKKESTGTLVIALPVAQGKLCMHFGHCEQFALLDVDTDARSILKTRELTPPAHEPGLLPRWLHEQGVNIVIAGGMGGRAQAIFAQNGIDVLVGAPPETPETLVQSYLDGTLQSGPNACDH